MGTKHITSSNNTYKVYTALLTQGGGDDPYNQTSGDLVIGYTYEISDYYSSGGWDFTNVGAPNNTVGTFFVATGTTPNSWDDGYLLANSSAPSVTLLENTLGNIWFTYQDIGFYRIESNGLFTLNKSTFYFGPARTDEGIPSIINMFDDYTINSYPFHTYHDSGLVDNVLFNTPIEIKVYN